MHIYYVKNKTNIYYYDNKKLECYLIIKKNSNCLLNYNIPIF